MIRESIPKKIKDTLLDEYNHRCAVCGGDRPHIHHIDEDHSHNEIENLIPLCPNCHLRDQHNPTRKVEIPKLRLFRKYKDPSILKPQFHPIFIRQLFLDEIVVNSDVVEVLENQARELTDFVSYLEMGKFYSGKINELIGPLNRGYISFSDDDSDYAKHVIQANKDYRKKLIDNREFVQPLLIEMLRYQSWANN